MRSDLPYYWSHYIKSHYTQKKMKAWGETSLDEFIWSEGMARAARSVANVEGPCGTAGGMNGEQPLEALNKYFAISSHDVTFYKYTSEILNEPPENILTWLISQDCIESSWLHREDRLHVGIGCSCADTVSEDHDLAITCYIGVAKDVVNKDIVENIPTYQEFVPGDNCASNCHENLFYNTAPYACPDG